MLPTPRMREKRQRHVEVASVLHRREKCRQVSLRRAFTSRFNVLQLTVRVVAPFFIERKANKMKSQQNPGEQRLHALKDTIAYDLSWGLALMIGARPHECYATAWDALIDHPDLFRDGSFIEGWLLIECESEVLVIEHGWCSQSDGQIVDPSIVLLVEDTRRVQFFPGVRRTWAETEALDGEMFPHVRFDEEHGEDGMGHLDYKAAYELAVQAATDLATSSIPPKTLTIQTAQPLLEAGQDGGGFIVELIVASAHGLL